MSMIDEIINAGFKINWTTIEVGWYGVSKYTQKLICIDDIVSYAVEIIPSCPPEQYQDIILIVGANNNDRDLIEYCLRNLTKIEKNDKNIEVRKWRFVLLDKLLKSLNNDPVYDLIKLTEFWGLFSYPEDSPHIIQGVNNTIIPKDYYSLSSYQEILLKHNIWMKQENEFLRSC